MKWWLYIALKQLFPTGRVVSFFAAVSVLGVALGVLGLFGTQSVMNGFHEQIGSKLRDTTGDVIIRQNGRAMKNLAPIVEELKKTKGVEAVELTARGPAMMLVNNVPTFPVLRSYDTVTRQCAVPIVEKGFVANGKIENLDDDTIIIGQRMAYSSGIGVGDVVEIISPTMLDKIKKDEVLMPTRLEVVGFLATDFSDVDSNVALVSLRRMRELYNLGEGTHAVILRLSDGVDCTKFARELQAKLKYPFRVSTWLTSNEAFLRVIKMEKVMMSLIIVLIILVASFSICISLYTSVLRKTREIGLMGAMGASPAQIAAMYCFQGFVIGVFGALAGLGLTVLVLHFREPLVQLIVGRESLIEFYHFAHLPVKYELSDALWASCFSIVLCTLAGFFPAMRAAGLKSSEAMRNE